MTYQLPVESTLRTAWAKVHGAKKTIWAAFAILLVVVFCLGFIQGIAEMINHALFQGMKLITNVVSYFLQIGILYIGICRAKDLPIHYQQMFRAFSVQRALNIVGLYIAQFILFIIPGLVIFAGIYITTFSFPVSGLMGGIIFALGVIASIYLLARLILGLAIVLDQDSGPIQAIKHSFHLTQGNVLRLCLLSLIQIIIVVISAIPFGIGLIWTLPFAIIGYGVIYQNLLKSQQTA